MVNTKILNILQSWNDSSIIKSNNCYSYAVNDMDYGIYTPQPGLKAGMPQINKMDLTCPNIWYRVKRDIPEAIKIENGKKCPKGYREVALVVDPYNDYHFYRKHETVFEIYRNGKWEKTYLWSHKQGIGKATLYDDSGNLITNPKYADRNYIDSKYQKLDLNYSDYCNNFCVPENNVNVCSIDQC
jgi:hypothetical protein